MENEERIAPEFVSLLAQLGEIKAAGERAAISLQLISTFVVSRYGLGPGDVVEPDGRIIRQGAGNAQTPGAGSNGDGNGGVRSLDSAGVGAAE